MLFLRLRHRKCRKDFRIYPETGAAHKPDPHGNRAYT